VSSTSTPQLPKETESEDDVQVDNNSDAECISDSQHSEGSSKIREHPDASKLQIEKAKMKRQERFFLKEQENFYLTQSNAALTNNGELLATVEAQPDDKYHRKKNPSPAAIRLLQDDAKDLRELETSLGYKVNHVSLLSDKRGLRPILRYARLKAEQENLKDQRNDQKRGNYNPAAEKRVQDALEEKPITLGPYHFVNPETEQMEFPLLVTSSLCGKTTMDVSKTAADAKEYHNHEKNKQKEPRFQIHVPTRELESIRKTDTRINSKALAHWRPAYDVIRQANFKSATPSAERQEFIARLAKEGVKRGMDQDNDFPGTFAAAVINLTVFNIDDRRIRTALRSTTFATPYIDDKSFKYAILMRIVHFEKADRAKHGFRSSPTGFISLDETMPANYKTALKVAMRMYKAEQLQALPTDTSTSSTSVITTASATTNTSITGNTIDLTAATPTPPSAINTAPTTNISTEGTTATGDKPTDSENKSSTKDSVFEALEGDCDSDF
jgi:hypothetical protein